MRSRGGGGSRTGGRWLDIVQYITCMFGNITAGWNGGLCTCSFLYRYLDANAVSFVVFCLHVHFKIRPTIAHIWRTYVRFGFLVARSHLPVH